MALDEKVVELIMNGRGGEGSIAHADELRYSAVTYASLEEGLHRMYKGRENVQATAITQAGNVVLEVDGKKVERPLSEFGYKEIGDIWFYRPKPRTGQLSAPRHNRYNHNWPSHRHRLMRTEHGAYTDRKP